MPGWHLFAVVPETVLIDKLIKISAWMCTLMIRHVRNYIASQSYRSVSTRSSPNDVILSG